MDSATITSLGRRINGRLERMVHGARARTAVRRLSGPRRFDLGADDVVVVALVRDGMYYLDTWLAHYRAIGARHFVFLDNGSQDGTPARLADEPGCIVLSADLPWGAFENALRGIGAERYARGHWCLYADMDELFDLPPGCSSLADLATDLRAGGASALIVQMLEMFPDAPLDSVEDLPFAQAVQRFDHCDISAIRHHDYHDPDIDFAWYLAQNTLCNPAIPVMFGGVRARVFGEACCLTKHPLVFLDGKSRPGVHPHCAAGVRCAGFSGLIRHYKFANAPFRRDRATAARGVIFHGEDVRRLAVADAAGDLRLTGPESRPYAGQADLYRRGFLTGPCSASAGGSAT